MKIALTALARSLAAVLLIGSVVRGQQPPNAPHAGYVYPAGGQQGTTLEVRIGGQFLDGVTRVLISGGGVRASVIEIDRPLTQRQITDLRDKLPEMQKNVATPGVAQEIATLRERIADSVRRNQSPVLSEYVTLEIVVAPDAEPGARQLRIGTPIGLSNPLVFSVGQLPEFREKDVKNSSADAELTIALPAVVNGRMIPGDTDRARFPLRQGPQYMPGDVDRYRFDARKGQQIVVAVSARELMPYLADAVPGWFQATVALFDTEGQEVAYEDDYRFHPDPVLHYQIPADGDYVVEIKDALYRGREDFVYRLSIGELPYVTGIFPLGGAAGAQTPVEVTGWNLRSDRVTMNGEDLAAGRYSISVRNGPLVSNRLPFVLDTWPELTEREPNNTPKQPQAVALPAVINGRIGQPGDWDVFRFAGHAGEIIVAEVSAHRLESPLDSLIELTDAAGLRIAFNDDYEDKGAGLETHHADSRLLVTLPATGTYSVRIGDAARKGGAAYAYRLRISAPRPDFDVRIAPSGVSAAGGATVPLTVLALRNDGFTGDITLALKDAPAGFTMSGGMIPAGQDQVRLTLTVPPVATREPLSLRVEARATIDGRAVVRQAMPADEMMQAFVYRHFVPADDLRVFVTGRGGTRAPARLLSPLPVTIPAGGTARVRVALPPAYQTFEKIQFELSDPPEGLTLRDVSVGQGGAGFVLHADAAKAKAGLRGNLIVTISGERVPPANAQAPAARRRMPLGTLPAIPFEIGDGSVFHRSGQ